MSEATVKALTDAIYDAYQDSSLLDVLDNEQVYDVARLAAQTIEAAGTAKTIVQAALQQVEAVVSAYRDDTPVGGLVSVFGVLALLEEAQS